MSTRQYILSERRSENMRIFVMSTPIIPPHFRGIVASRTVSPESITVSIGTWIASGVEVVSFCGHSQTAEFLGVEMNRGELSGRDLKPGDQLVGIRPLRRPQPGEEITIDIDNFQGFVMEVIDVAPQD